VLIVISGPSGAGKGTLCEAVPSIPLALSWTTRPRRTTDKPRQYRYVNEQEFTRGEENGSLLEWVRFGDYSYGLAVPPKDTLCITDIDVHGAIALSTNSMIDSLFIAVLPPEPMMRVLKERLKSRGDTNEFDIARRLRIAREEIQTIRDRADIWLPRNVVINDNALTARDQLFAVLTANGVNPKLLHPANS